MRRVGLLKLRTVAALGAAALAMTTGVASATPAVGSVSVVLARGTVSDAMNIETDGLTLKTKKPFDIVTQTVTFQPGGTSGWHSHPGPVFVAVKSGTVTVYDGSCVTRRYSAGHGFVEGPEPAVVRNEGTVVSENVATLLVPTGSPSRYDSPSLCPGIDAPAVTPPHRFPHE